MEPRLIGITGPLQGEIFVINRDECYIGRDSDWLVLSDSSASRQHCLIKREQENFKLQDLHSRNGTFINGIPIREKILQNGDRVEIGNSLFLFLLEESGSLRKSAVALKEDALHLHSTVRVRIEDVLYLKPTEFNVSGLPPTKLISGLQALLIASAALSSIRQIELLQQKLMMLVFQNVPAEHGAIVLSSPEQEEFTSSFAAHRDSTCTEVVPISYSVVKQVVADRAAILSNDVHQDFKGLDSLIARKITSVLCAPLLVQQRTIGALYLSSTDPGILFDEDHLQIVTAIGTIAAVAIENCRYLQELANENQILRSVTNIEHEMIGESPSIQNICDFISRAAPVDSTVLIDGETGSGKELVAQAIHRNSRRCKKPFIAINCATLSEGLLESELFGHERGAFTGAIAQKKGKLEMADQGTVFLDEVTEMDVALQAKLLRTLQEYQLERIGGTRLIEIDIRLIAATNRNLEEAVKKGKFREDLFYRLNVLRITIPPLRERSEDIPLLASHFVAKYCKKVGRKILGISAAAMRCLACYRWPGNIRELENAIQRALVMGSSDWILPEDLPESILESRPPDVPLTRYEEAVREAKRHLVLKAIEECDGDFAKAAKVLEIHPNNLRRLIRNLNLKSILKGSQ